jgi:hypothetical protein
MWRIVGGLFLVLCLAGLAAQEAPEAESTENTESADRQTIPEFLRQPQRGEAPRYPTDTIIGSLARGDVPADAYDFAREVLGILVAGNKDAPVFSAMNSVELEKIFSDLEKINPRKFRLGKGQEEVDGAFSFLVRFIGRDKGMAGELYIRPVPPAGEAAEAVQNEEEEEGEEEAAWLLDDLILEEERGLDEVIDGPSFDLPPYERFF